MISRLFKLLLSYLFVSFTAFPNDTLELNTRLMRSTFKIAGNGMIGTVFILGEPMKGESDRAYYVLITANHILDKMKGDEAIIFLREKIDDSYRKIAYPITIRKKGEPLWVRHPEVDIAAMYINLPNDIDFPSLSISTLADDKIFEKYEIRPGDELLCLGFPFGREANPAGFPILRSGRIASYPIKF